VDENWFCNGEPYSLKEPIAYGSAALPAAHDSIHFTRKASEANFAHFRFGRLRPVQPPAGKIFFCDF
jgi:hypothetical protein